MLQEACNLTSDPSTLRRLTFAATALPKDTPKYWEFVTSFGYYCSQNSHVVEQTRIFVENLRCIDANSLAEDKTLMKELMAHSGFQGHPIGIVLISSNKSCKLCGGNLLIRHDRPSFPVVYSEDLGSIAGTHFRKYCSNSTKGCSFVQHYGCYTIGNVSTLQYDENCLDLPYFLSSSMTVFATELLTRLSAEILLGQMSYKQKADVFNYCHGYDIAIKKETSYRDLQTSR